MPKIEAKFLRPCTFQWNHLLLWPGSHNSNIGRTYLKPRTFLNPFISYRRQSVLQDNNIGLSFRQMPKSY